MQYLDAKWNPEFVTDRKAMFHFDTSNHHGISEEHKVHISVAIREYNKFCPVHFQGTNFRGIIDRRVGLN